jgi:PAS domain S-box-containing protein
MNDNHHAEELLERLVRQRTAELTRLNEALRAEVARGREAQETARESEARFRDLFENANDIIYTLDLEGRITSVNKRAEQAFGYTLAEALGHSVREWVPPEHHARMDEALRRKLAGEEAPTVYELDIFSKDGRRVPLEVSSRLIVRGGRPVGIQGIARDISERLRAEQALRDSEERLRLALDAGQCGVWDWDIPRNHVTWSERIYEFHGLAPETFGGRAEDFVALVHPEDAGPVSEAIRAAIKGAKPYSQEFRIVRPGGEVRWLATNGRVLYGESGRAVRMLGATIDVTKRRAAEEALRAAARRKDEFLAMLAHELRNPLAPIRNATQVIKLLGPAEPSLAKAREMIDRQVSHLARLVDDLLDVSRITRGKVLLRKEWLDLVPLVRSAVEDHRGLLEGTGLTLSAELPESPLWVEGDPTRLAQVVGNLLHNANKFTDAGGRVNVRLAASPEAEEAVLSVRDTGTGMEEDIQARLFEPFSQADRSLDRSRGGLGLGLALVKGLAELHGGCVRATSPGPGRGSEFTVYLPLSRQPERVEAAARQPEATARPLRVLVIEDHPDAAESLRMLLQVFGHAVAVAHAGKVGLESARVFRPDVVLCDIGLPGGMDGYAVADALRRDPEAAGMALIALSGYGQEEDKRRARQAGFDRHLTKPVDPQTLAQLLGGLPRRPGG